MIPTKKELADAKTNVRHLRRYGLGGRFLDLGANVGCVSNAAIEQFDEILAVEAHPDTFKRMKQNLFDGILKLHAAVAAVGNQKFWVSTPKNSTGSTARPKKRLLNPPEGYYREVSTVSFQWLLDEFRPRVVKMDIEGGEYECLADFKPNFDLEYIQIEWHNIHSGKKLKEMKNIEQTTLKGFRRVYPNQINETEQGHAKAMFQVAVYRKK